MFRFGTLLLIILFALPLNAQDFRPDPEMATGVKAASASAIGNQFMIVTANPLATQAGYKILKNGGTAADAAITAQLVLGLVEPQSSGLGGGAFALYYNAESKKLSSWDGREVAPHSSTPAMFLNPQTGQPIPFWDAVIGPQSVGVPGTPKLLHQLHTQFGKMEWPRLFPDAIRLAENGFTISPRMAKMIEADKGKLDRFQTTKDYFYTAGAFLKNPSYARTLNLFKFMGADAFYHPQMIGGDIIQATDGRINKQDLANYKVIQRDPVCGLYRDYQICSMGEPSSGGLTILKALKILEAYDNLHPNDPQTIHRIAEASKMAFADRNMYMADPDFVDTPGMGLLNPLYIDKRRALMTDKAQKYQPGNLSDIFAMQDTQPEEGTTHIVAIDMYGNAISMTSTIESAFGSKIMTNGFLLNNELTDFAFVPVKDGKPVANAIAPGKRPRSSMAPTIVFDRDGRPLLLIGSAGGSRIIGYILHRLIAVLDWGMDINAAMAMPNMVDRGNGLEIENTILSSLRKQELSSFNSTDPHLHEDFGDGDNALLSQLKQKGHDIQIRELNSGLTAIYVDPKKGLLYGSADPRREGVGMGE